MEKSLKGFKQVLMITLLLWEKSRNTGGLDQGANIEKLWCLEYIALKKFGCMKESTQMGGDKRKVLFFTSEMGNSEGC